MFGLEKLSPDDLAQTVVAKADRNGVGTLRAVYLSGINRTRSSCRPTHVSLMACPRESGAIDRLLERDGTAPPALRSRLHSDVLSGQLRQQLVEPVHKQVLD